MRELKFRAWHKILKNYAHIKRIWLDGDGDGHDEIFAVSDAETTYPIHEVVLEQYTGLKDKNGKEIYEGDIVEACAMKMGGQIVYDNVEYFAYRIVGFGGEESLNIHLGNFDWHKLEIIGNIHENPELLEEEQ